MSMTSEGVNAAAAVYDRLCAQHAQSTLLFLQVSADNPKEANRHTMLRSRKWWEEKFAAHGADVNHEMLWAMQYKNHRWALTADIQMTCVHGASAHDADRST